MSQELRVSGDGPGLQVFVGPDTNMNLVVKLEAEGVITVHAGEFNINRDMKIEAITDRLSLAWAHYTPDEYLDAVRKVMGGIDTDPASCKIAQYRVKAETFYTSEDNGLEQPWLGRVLLCPSYSQPHLSNFIRKAFEEFDNGNMTECIFLTHTGETWETWFQSIISRMAAVCFVSGHIHWVTSWVGYEEELKELGFDLSLTPSHTEHGSMLAYVGPNVGRFVEVFSEFGTVLQKAPGV